MEQTVELGRTVPHGDHDGDVADFELRRRGPRDVGPRRDETARQEPRPLPVADRMAGPPPVDEALCPRRDPEQPDGASAEDDRAVVEVCGRCGLVQREGGGQWCGPAVRGRPQRGLFGHHRGGHLPILTAVDVD